MDLTIDGKTVFAFTNSRDFAPEKPTILFVHGAGMDHSVWTLQARYFAHHGFNAVAIDLPGHGRSEGPARSTIEDMADSISGVVQNLDIDQATIIGHSMGALITLETACRHPSKVQRIALLGAALAMPVHPALLEAAKADQPLAVELVSSWGHGVTGHFGGNRAPGGWLMGHAVKLLAKAPPGVLHNDLAACNAYHHGEEAAGEVGCHTLIVNGDHDRMTPTREGAKLAQLINGASLATIEGSGHLMLVEKPDATLDALISWFDT